jgi:hypothetical protein
VARSTWYDDSSLTNCKKGEYSSVSFYDDYPEAAPLLTRFKSFPAHSGTLNTLLCAPIIIGPSRLSCASSTFAKDSTADSNAFHRLAEAKAAENRGDWTTAIDLLTKITEPRQW